MNMITSFLIALTLSLASALIPFNGYRISNNLFKLSVGISPAAKEGEKTYQKLETIASTAANVVAVASTKVKELNDEYDLVNKGKDTLIQGTALAVETLFKANELNQKYKISEKVAENIELAATKLGVEGQTIEATKATLRVAGSKVAEINAKAVELNNEFHLVNKGKEALFAAGKLAGEALVKAAELNEKHHLVEKAGRAVGTAVGSAVDKVISIVKEEK